MPNRIIRESINTSANLARVSFAAETLFLHLTTKADDYGCFPANPKIIIGACFPLRKVRERDLEGWLAELAAEHLIELYEVQGKRLLHLTTWADHQRRRESKPKYPLPIDPQAVCRDLPQPAANGGESPQLAARARTLENESREREARDENERREARGGDSAEPSSQPQLAAKPPDTETAISPDEIAQAWNELCEPLGLATVREVRGSRRDKVAARLRDHPAPDFWRAVFQAIPRQGFLLGENDRGWRIDFDFLFKNDVNAVRVAEGKYVGKPKQAARGR